MRVAAAAGVGWLAAPVVAFAIVALVDFLGIGLIGMSLAFASAQVERVSQIGAARACGARMIPPQMEAEEQMTPEQRVVGRNDPLRFLQPGPFFRHLGLGLALIGFGGLIYRYF